MKDAPQDIPGLAQYLPATGRIPQLHKEYDKCMKCGTKLYGGERSGDDATGYCDVCQEVY